MLHNPSMTRLKNVSQKEALIGQNLFPLIHPFNYLYVHTLFHCYYT